MSRTDPTPAQRAYHHVYGHQPGWVVHVDQSELEQRKPKPQTAERRIQAAHDGLEDAQAALESWRRRSAVTATVLAAGIAVTLAGTTAMWLGPWLLAIPVILLGLAGTIWGGLETCARFLSGTGVDRQRDLRRAERQLRDALTEHDGGNP